MLQSKNTIACALTFGGFLVVGLTGCIMPEYGDDLIPGYNYVGHVESGGAFMVTYRYPSAVQWTAPTDSTRIFIGQGYGAWDIPEGRLDTIHFVLRNSAWGIGNPGDDYLTGFMGALTETPDSLVFILINVDVSESYYLRKR